MSAAAPTALDPRVLARNKLLIGIALAMAGAVAFSSKAILVKLIYRYGADPETTLALRMAFSLPFFGIVALWSARRSGVEPLRQGDWWRVLYLGLSGYYLSSYLDFMGLQYISAALERLILYLNPTLVVLISIFAFKRPIRRAQLFALAVSYSGVVVIFAHDLQSAGPHFVLGSALVFASSLLYAGYLIFSGEMVRRLGALRLASYASVVACAACIIQFFVMRSWATLDLPLPVFWYSGLNAVACTVLPMFAVMMAVDRIGAPLASQLGLVGPVSTIVLGVVVLGEQMGPWQILGAVLVLVGVYMVTRPAGSQ